MKVQCKVSGYHPATHLDLVEGEMDVAPEVAAELEAAGLLLTEAPAKRRTPKASDAQKEEA